MTVQLNGRTHTTVWRTPLHILLKCRANTQELTWKNAKGLWPQEWQQWPNITIGTILGVGQIALPENERRQAIEHKATSTCTRGQMRLLQILISKASHLT